MNDDYILNLLKANIELEKKINKITQGLIKIMILSNLQQLELNLGLLFENF